MTDTKPTPLHRANVAMDELFEASCKFYQHVHVSRCLGCDECYRLTEEYNARIASYNDAMHGLLSP